MDNETLERAAQILEGHATNDMYRKAFRAGAKLLRSKKLPDNGDQIILSDRSSGAPASPQGGRAP